MDPATIMEVIKIGGPTVAVLIFVLYWFKQTSTVQQQREAERETRLGARLDAVQERHDKTMSEVVRVNTETMQRSNLVMERSAAAMEQMSRVMEGCPRRKE